MIQLQQLAKVKDEFVIRHVEDEWVLVPLNDNVADMSEMFTLNEVGGFIWGRIDQNSSLEEIEGAVTEEFDIDRNTAKEDLEIFLEELNHFLSRYY